MVESAKLKPSDKVQYYLKCPSEKTRQKKFTIVKRIIREDGTKEHSVVEDSRLDTINKLWLTNQRKKEASRRECNLLIRDLYKREFQRRGKLITSADNNKILELYLDKKYPKGKRRDMDFNAVRNETARCLRILGHESLTTITQEKLQACVDNLEADKQKRYVSRLRSILKTMGITGIELYFSRSKRKRVSYITVEDLETLCSKIKHDSIGGLSGIELCFFYRTLFATGMRIGEALAVEPEDFVKGKYYIKVNKQLKQDKKIADTKNKKARKAVVISGYIDDVEAWVKFDKSKVNRFEVAKYLSRKTKELFTDKNKHISCHGLRHSYAIHLLRVVETTISNVATFLGDSIKTTEDYYIDFMVDDQTIENVVSKMKA